MAVQAERRQLSSMLTSKDAQARELEEAARASKTGEERAREDERRLQSKIEAVRKPSLVAESALALQAMLADLQAEAQAADGAAGQTHSATQAIQVMGWGPLVSFASAGSPFVPEVPAPAQARSLPAAQHARTGTSHIVSERLDAVHVARQSLDNPHTDRHGG